MVTTILLLAGALGQLSEHPDWQLAPQLQSGMELVYSGSYLEESLGPNVNHQRRYQLDTMLFVLDAGRERSEVAFLTSLGLRDPSRDTQGNAKDHPVSVRLEVAALDAQGRLTGSASLLPPVAGPPTLECGFLVETNLKRLGRDPFWEINEEGRPPRTWQVAGTETCAGVTCIKVIGNQQSDDWDRPRGDHAAWRRRDTIWLVPRLGVAQKVERVIERREPARRDPTQRASVRYELESRLKYPGRLFEDRRQEVLRAKRFQEDARPLLAQPGQYGPQIEALLRKVSYHLESQPPTPYRKAIVAVQNQLERARRGEAPPEIANDEERGQFATAVGQRVPDFIVADLAGKESARLARVLGRPVLIVFYKPVSAASGHSQNPSNEALRFAADVQRQYADQVRIMAMAVTDDVDLARKQHADLRLPFPVLDGKGLHLTFGVADTPRFIVLDGEGVLRFATTGWGVQTPDEIRDELARCMPR